MTKLNNLKLFLAFTIIILFSSCITLGTLLFGWTEPTGNGHYSIIIHSLEEKDNIELKVNVPKSIFGAAIYTRNINGVKEFPSIDGELLDRSFDANKLFSIENKSDKAVKVFLDIFGGVNNKDVISTEVYKSKDVKAAMTDGEFIEKVKENDKEWLSDYWSKLNKKNKYLAIEIEPHSTYNVPWTI